MICGQNNICVCWRKSRKVIILSDLMATTVIMHIKITILTRLNLTMKTISRF